MMEIIEKGPWYAGVAETNGKVFVYSDDFTHDVCLYVTGDFADALQHLAYAEEIAKRLNAWK